MLLKAEAHGAEPGAGTVSVHERTHWPRKLLGVRKDKKYTRHATLQPRLYTNRKTVHQLQELRVSSWWAVSWICTQQRT